MQTDNRPIILVEDNESDAEVARRAIERTTKDRRFIVIDDGATAAEVLLRDRSQATDPEPCLVMVDINLPGLDGIEPLTRIRRHPRLCNVSVVIISSSVEESDIRRAYGRGANSYVTKPVDNRALQSLYASVANYWTLTNIACPETAG